MKDNIRINVIVNLIRTVVLTLLSFITFPWICRYLGDSYLGAYSWATTFIAYFIILSKIGIPNLALRECIKVRDDKEKLSNKAQMFFILQMITTLISFILLAIIVFSIPAIRDMSILDPNLPDTKVLIFILAINVLSTAFSFEWIFVALEKQFYMSIRSIIVLAISSIMIIALVTTPDDIYLYAFLSVMVTFATMIINLFYVRKHISFKKTLPYDFKFLLKPLLILGSVSMLLSLYNQTDTFVLGFIDEGKTQVGSYSVGIKGIDIVIAVLSNLSTVFVPRATYYYEKEDKRFFNNLTRYSFNICLFIVLPAIAMMSTLANPICSLISGSNDLTAGDFTNSHLVLIIVSSMMLTYTLSEMIYGQILIPMKKEKFYLYSILFGVILNVCLSIVLGLFVFKKNPAIGVAIGTLITDLLIFIYLIIVTNKWTFKALFNKNTLKLVISTVVVFAICFFLNNPLLNLFLNITNDNYSMSMLLNLITLFVLNLLVYVGSLLLMKEDLVYSFIKKTPKQI